MAQEHDHDQTDSGSDGEDGFPEVGGEVVDFGWQDERKVTGRRKKAQQAAKKKAKPGTFGK